jgi:signal transduction histidine kinase
MNSRVLIVDDDDITREALHAILKSDDYQIELATNGYDAIEKAKELSPDIILLDVMMPEIDGFEVCRRIRRIPEIAEVPVLILTSLDDQESLLEGIKSGADDFLSKPVNRFELRARVNTITRLNRYRRLKEEQARIREMANKIITLQEDERRRIAQELHDELGQSLTTLSISLKLLSGDLSDPAIQARIADMLNLTRDTLNQLRLLGHELRPPALDMIGICPTLEGYCRDFTQHTQLPILFFTEGTIPTLPDPYNITLYRFLQEALTNIVKHAGASQVWVRLFAHEKEITFSVRDDGHGFPQAQSGSQPPPFTRKDGSTGMGLLGIQERIDLLDGTFKIDSQPGQGSRLTVSFPIPA